MSVGGTCPVCEIMVDCTEGVEESEILTCPDCQTRLVVESVNSQNLVFNEAPRIEEDWGQ